MKEKTKDTVLRVIFLSAVTFLILTATLIPIFVEGGLWVGLVGGFGVYVITGILCAMIADSWSLMCFITITFLWWPMIASQKFAEYLLDKLDT